MGLNMSYSDVPLMFWSDFHRAMPHLGIPLIVQFSIANLPDHTARLLVIAYELANKPRGFLPLHHSSITTR